MKKKRLLAVFLILALLPAGCRKETGPEEIAKSDEEGYEESYEESYKQIYEQAKKDQTLGSLETMQEMVRCLGSKGYAAIDVSNEVNLENPELVRAFCEQVEEEKEAALSIFTVTNQGGYVRYDLQTANKEVQVTASAFLWEDDKLKLAYTETYPAASWVREQNYLFFDKEYPPGLDGSFSHTAIRIEPLDETLREWNRLYVQPVGYGLNNLFLTDWSEADYKNLNFYDLYETLYQMKYQKTPPYGGGYENKKFEIPEQEFEEVFQSYFSVTSLEIQKRTDYDPQKGVYAYRPRGLYDGAAPLAPYPEVLDLKEQEDGTLVLTIRAVWPERNQEQALLHELTVRPLENGGFQYVSNHVLSWEVEEETSWYIERLTEEAWEELYGEEEAKTQEAY